MCVRVCARVTLSQELSRGLIARARVWPSAYKVLRVAAFFFKCRFSFFFLFLEKRFKALRYVTSSAAAPCSKMRFFRKNNRLHNTRAPSQKEKKGELFTRARARKEEEEEEEEERSARAFEKKTP